MKKFDVASYQLAETKKWIPAGTLIKFISNSGNVEYTEVEIREKEFETKEEANSYFIDYYKSKGFMPNSKS